jgi:hypothetical protein
MKKGILLFLGILLSGLFFTACEDDDESAKTVTAEFENLSLSANSHWDGSDMSGDMIADNTYQTNMKSGELIFPNTYYTGDFPYWEGFAYSNETDVSTPGYANQYSCFAGSGANNSDIFMVTYVSSFNPPVITHEEGGLFEPLTMYVTNTTYAALSMKDGDMFTKKFGGESGDDPDWFKLTIKGIDETGAETGAVEFYLADFRPADNTQDYILDQWEVVDISSLGEVQQLTFELSSSDVGDYGMNTPAYFCLDDLKIRVK